MYYLVKVKNDEGIQIKTMTAQYLAKKLDKNFNDNIKNRLYQVYEVPAYSDKELLNKLRSDSIEFNEWIPIQNKVQYNSTCVNYIALEYKFKWILDMYLKEDYIELYRRLALNNEADKLVSHLTQLWMALPEGSFNIEVNPEGWKELLSIIDNHVPESRFTSNSDLTKILINDYRITSSDNIKFKIISPSGVQDSITFDSIRSAMEYVNNLILKDNNIKLN